MQFELKDKYFVVRYQDGTFLKLEETVAITHNSHVDNPVKATKVRPVNKDWTCLHETEYYFETSDRMRRWLAGGKLILVESMTVAETIE